jgi:hypothetical protein
MSKRLITDDTETGIKTYLQYDGTDDDAIIVKEQDATNIVEANRAAFDAAPARWGDMTHVGRIPLTVYYELERKGILQDQVALVKWLNDPENAMWRTRPGNV